MSEEEFAFSKSLKVFLCCTKTFTGCNRFPVESSNMGMRPLSGSEEQWGWWSNQHQCCWVPAVLEKHIVPNEKGLPTAVPYKPSRHYTAGKSLPLWESNRSNGCFLPRIWLDLESNSWPASSKQGFSLTDMKFWTCCAVASLRQYPIVILLPMACTAKSPEHCKHC